MSSDIEEWWRISTDDLEKAKILFKNNKYDGTIFYCQQSIEKALKAVLIVQKKRVPKVHDLVLLSKEVSLAPEFLETCKELSYGYIYTRYPSAPAPHDIVQKATELLRSAGEILQWLKKKYMKD